MNRRQSEGMAGILARAGYRIVSCLDQADVVLFNGCSVRQKAEEKLLGRLGAVAREKLARRVILGVGGCMGQIHGERLLARSRIIDFVFGTGGHANLPEWIERAKSERLVMAVDPVFLPDEPVCRSCQITGMVTISEGCANRCAYCVVPFARGPLRCRPADHILREVGAMRAEGFQDVTLLGQNVNVYRDPSGAVNDFAELLQAVSDSGMPRVRFTTSHPRDLSGQTLQVMAERSNVCPHLHLACQSGSDRMLTAMRRGYDRATYVERVSTARQMIPAVNVTTDLIVGFPGETEADFRQTLGLMEEIRFGSVFGAKYSPRPYTEARSRVDDVPREIKAERLERLLALQRTIAAEENARWIGRDVRLLVEGSTQDGRAYGRAEDHRTVVADAAVRVGAWITVRVGASSAASLSGSILAEEDVGGRI